MIDPIRQEILQKIQRMSELAPDLRFGQIVANLATHAAGPWDQTLWNVGDDQLLTALRKQVADLTQRAQQGVA